MEVSNELLFPPEDDNTPGTSSLIRYDNVINHANNNNMRINYSFYKDHELVPIEDVAKALGVEPKRNGKYLCVCHDDTNPSMVISKSGKYENTFHCFSCGETGDPFMLVLSAKFGIVPSEYWKTPVKERYEKYGAQIKEAALFIEDYFPGAVTYKEEEYRKNADGFPIIPPSLLKEIGLSVNYLSKQRVKPYADLFKEDKQGNKQYFFDKEIEYLQGHNQSVEFDEIDKNEAVELLYNKLKEYLADLDNYRKVIFNEHFPLLYQWSDSRHYINHVIAEKYDKAKGYLAALEEYIINKNAELAFTPETLNEMEKDFNEYYYGQREIDTEEIER